MKNAGSRLPWDIAAQRLEEIKSTTNDKRVFDLVIDFGTSQSPKSTRPLTT
ncbi:hypothetical protein [Thiolapillus sp.]|uniref:hypothetical protein n=1 Tax=Thiolapillus sp. TaxID=2017437 RepID=UPI003AF8A2DC